MCPGEQCVSGTYDVKGAEDLLVVLREYARKVDVEIVSAIFRVPRRHACERARAVVECKHQDLDEHNCHKPDRQSVTAVPGEHRYGNDATGVASTKDISVGGFYMNTQANLPEGAALLVRIPLADGRQIIANADVVYSNPGRGVGLRFRDLSDENRTLIESELAS